MFLYLLNVTYLCINNECLGNIVVAIFEILFGDATGNDTVDPVGWCLWHGAHVLWFISLLSSCLCSVFENHSHFHSYSHSFLFYSCPCEDKRDVLRCKCVCVYLHMWWLILWLHSFSQLIGLFTSLEWNDFMEVPDWLLQSCDLLCQMPIPM